MKNVNSNWIAICLLFVLSSIETYAQCSSRIASNINPINGCEILTVLFSDSSTGTVVQRIWNFGDGSATTSTQNPTKKFYAGVSSDTTYTVSLIIECVGNTHDTDQVEVTVFQRPRVSVISSKTSLCAVIDSVCFTNNSSQGAGITHSWNFGDFTQSTDISPCHKYFTSGNYIVNLTLNNSNNCPNDTNISLTVKEAPSPEFSVNTHSGCAPLEVTFTNTTNTTLSPVSSWLWNWGDGTPDSTQKNPGKHTFTSMGNYIVSLIATNLTGCTNITTTAISVIFVPSVTISSSDPDQTICKGDSVLFTVSPGGLGNYSYFNNSLLLNSGVSETYLTDSLKNNSRIFAQVEVPFCGTVNSDTLLFSVKEPLPVPTINCGLSSLDSIEFIWDKITGSTGYEVSQDGITFSSPSSGMNGLKHLFTGLNPNDSVTLTVRALGQPPCGNSINSLPVTCYAIQCDPITFDKTIDTSICKGETIVISINNLITPSDSFSIKWNNLAPGKDSIFVFSQTISATIKVAVFDSSQSECKATEKSINITVNPIPSVTLSSSAIRDTSCSGNEVNFTASPAGYDDYLFFSGYETLQQGSDNIFRTNSLLNSDSVQIQVTDKGCAKTGNEIKTVIMEPLIPPDINCGVTTQNSIEFTWDSIPGVVEFQISLDGEPFMNISGPGNSHFITGLNFGDTVDASIIALGKFPCGNSVPSPLKSCYAIECQPITFNKSPDTSLCIGDSIQLKLTNIYSISGKVEVYLNGELKGTDSVFTIIPAKDSIVNILISDALQPQCPATEKNFTVTVNPLPVVTISFSEGDTICQSSILTLQSNPGYERYLFYKGTALLGDTTTPFLEYSGYSDHDFFKIEAMDKNCKNNSGFKKINVKDSLQTPLPNCGNSTINSVSFFWTEISGATGYEISIDGGIFKNPDSGPEGLNQTISSLNPLDTVSIQVRALGNAPCGNSTISTKVSCIAMNCIMMDFEKVQDFSSCYGDSVTVFIKNLQTPSPNKFIQWNNEPRSMDTLKKFMVLNDTSITVALGDSSQPLCSMVNKIINVKVNPIPVATLYHSSQDDTLCSGENVVFTTNPPGYQNYSFLMNDIIMQDSVFNTFSISTLMDSSSVRVITKDKGCLDTSNSFFLRVLETPPVILSRIPAGDTLCTGVILNFEIANSFYTYFTFFRDTSIYQSGALTKLLSDTLTGKVNIFAKGSYPNQCESPLSNTENFFIQKIPVIDISSSTLSDSLCDYDTLTLNATPPGYSFYKFFKNGNLIQDSKEVTLKLTGITQDDSLWVVSGLSGCTHKSNVKRFTIFSTPDLILLKDKPDSVCFGDTIIFTALPQTYSRYLFFNGFSLIQDSLVSNLQISTLNNPALIRVIGKTVTGCHSDTSQITQITINAIPAITLTKSFTGNQACERDTLVFTATPGYDEYEFYNFSQLLYSGTNNFVVSQNLRDSASLYAFSINKSCRSLSTDTIPLILIPKPSAFITGDTLICTGSIATLYGSGGISHFWNDGNTTDTLQITPVKSDTVWMVSDSLSCKSDTANFIIRVDTLKPRAVAGNDTIICTDTPFQLNGKGGKNFLWSPGDFLDSPTQPSPKVQGLSSSVIFILRVMNDACQSFDTLKIIIDRCLNTLSEDKIPVFFTPNGDGTNDLWAIKDIDYFPDAKVLILNRWGEMVFKNEHYLNTWDGNNPSSFALPDGTYYYIIELNNGTKPLTGFIVLKR